MGSDCVSNLGINKKILGRRWQGTVQAWSSRSAPALSSQWHLEQETVVTEASEALLVSSTVNPLHCPDLLVFSHISSSLISQSFLLTDPFPTTQTPIRTQEPSYVWTSGHFSHHTKWIIACGLQFPAVPEGLLCGTLAWQQFSIHFHTVRTRLWTRLVSSLLIV